MNHDHVVFGRRCVRGYHSDPDIPGDQAIMVCVAVGFPDDSFPANAVVSTRRPVDELVNFHGFD